MQSEVLPGDFEDLVELFHPTPELYNAVQTLRAKRTDPQLRIIPESINFM